MNFISFLESKMIAEIEELKQEEARIRNRWLEMGL
jgi:hypothetical protein